MKKVDPIEIIVISIIVVVYAICGIIEIIQLSGRKKEENENGKKDR